MRRFIRFTGVGLGALVASLTLAPPAGANHVLQPACDAVRQGIITAQTAATNAQATLISAQNNLNTALANVGTAQAQAQVPTANYIIALEDNVGVSPAQSAFNTSLSVFSASINLYVARLGELVTLTATRDINQQVVAFLQGVRAGLAARIVCPSPI